MFLKDKKNLSGIIILVLAIFLIWSTFLLVDYFSKLAAIKTVVINGQKIEVELAKTNEQKTLGLSQHDSLPPDQGRLFVYSQYLIPKYWMKDMKFPIDIIWIKDDMVVGYEKNLQPAGDIFNIPTYQPKTFINYVLEVNAGWADQSGVKIGDELLFDI